MTRVRVLIVDDSALIRRILSDILAAETWIEVVATAPNGRIALQKIDQLSPDLVTLDIEMPELDGLETLTELRRKHAKLPVIMVSSVTEQAATVTLEALSRGATDYVTKPQKMSNLAAAQASVREGLVEKIAALFPGRAAAVKAAPTPLRTNGTSFRSSPPRRIATTPGMPAVMPPSTPRPVALLAVGSSTGGPNALATIFDRLPLSFPVPIVVTQHMPPLFTRLLAERLAGRSRRMIVEAKGNERLEPGAVYIAQGEHHLVFERRGAEVWTALSQSPPENSCRPAVDVMFRSAANAYGGGVLALVLTGMGQDGLRGCEAICAAGGRVIAQDEASSVVWGMPGAVVRAGLADAIVPLDGVVDELVRRVDAISVGAALVKPVAGGRG